MCIFQIQIGPWLLGCPAAGAVSTAYYPGRTILPLFGPDVVARIGSGSSTSGPIPLWSTPQGTVVPMLANAIGMLSKPPRVLVG